MALGGYVLHPQVGEEETAIFKYAMKDHLGMRFNPIAVASQATEDANYIFICSGTPVVLHPETKLYAVKICTHLAPCIAPEMKIESINEINIPALALGK